MSTDPVEITQFNNLKHREQVVSLWEEVFGYDAKYNAPALVIDKKCAAGDGLFFVAVSQRIVLGTIMAGYDGHRGWIYSMAVHPNHRKKGIGSALLAFTEKKLSSLGCMKINLQIMDYNEAVQRFYQANGYVIEERISMGKRLNGE